MARDCGFLEAVPLLVQAAHSIPVQRELQQAAQNRQRSRA
jgi:hypothetical protein